MSEQDYRLFDAVERNDANAAETVQQAFRDGANANAVLNYVTPLLEACGKGFYQIVDILLNGGAEIKRRKSRDWSAIVFACRNGQLSAIQLLINRDNRLLNMTNSRGWTPLIVAIGRQHSDIVRFLLDSGANARHVDHYGITALMHACACQVGSSLEIVRLLLAAGADVEARDRSQQTALHDAVYSGGIETVLELIIQHNANMFVVDEDGCTPFDLACGTEGRADVVDNLLVVYGNKLTQDHGRLALHELLKVAEYSFVENEELFHPPLNSLQIMLPLGKLTLAHLHTLLHTLDPELVRNRDDTGKLPIHIACQTNAPVEILGLILELDPAVLHIADSTGALSIHLLFGSTTAAEYASARYLIQSFPGSVAVQTRAGDYPFMMAAAAESPSASVSVIYELVRANPGLVVPR